MNKKHFRYAPVAQLDRVFGYEPKGRGFESLLAYQINRFFRKDEPVFLIFRTVKGNYLKDCPLFVLCVSEFKEILLCIR